MALGASVYKINVDLSDTDRHVYMNTRLTLACHPSETVERMMVRFVVWCFCAHDDLAFGKGISTDDEPDLWQKDATGAVEHWIEVGQPGLDRIKKARGRSQRQSIFTFGRGRDQWWSTVEQDFERISSLQVKHLSSEETAALANLQDKSMSLSVCISEGTAYLTCGTDTLTITPKLSL